MGRGAGKSRKKMGCETRQTAPLLLLLFKREGYGNGGTLCKCFTTASTYMLSAVAIIAAELR